MSTKRLVSHITDIHGNLLKSGDKVKRVKDLASFKFNSNIVYIIADVTVSGVSLVNPPVRPDSPTRPDYWNGYNFIKISGISKTPAVKRNTNIRK